METEREPSTSAGIKQNNIESTNTSADNTESANKPQTTKNKLVTEQESSTSAGIKQNNIESTNTSADNAESANKPQAAQTQYCVCFFIEAFKPRPSVQIPIKQKDILIRKKIILDQIASDINLPKDQIEFCEQTGGNDYILLNCIVPQEYFQAFWDVLPYYAKALKCKVIKTTIKSIQQGQKIVAQREKDKNITSIGDVVKILEGEWLDFTGCVIDIQDNLYHIRITMFANVFTVVRLEASQIKKQVK